MLNEKSTLIMINLKLGVQDTTQIIWKISAF